MSNRIFQINPEQKATPANFLKKILIGLYLIFTLSDFQEISTGSYFFMGSVPISCSSI
jgi:hypothetical protein